MAVLIWTILILQMIMFDYILQNLYPKGVEVTPEFADLYGSWEIKLFSFEKLLPTINFQLRNLNL